MADNFTEYQNKIIEHESRQAKDIEEEQKALPLIGLMESPECLRSVYEGAIKDGFLKAIEILSKNYMMRRVRGDGNCFYRALLFGYLDQLLVKFSSSDARDEALVELERMSAIMKGSMNDLVQVGYNEFAIETFYDMFNELLEGLPNMSRESLLQEFQENGSGDHYTWYMRALTAGYMKSHPDDFFPFIVADGVYGDIASFCEKEVEPMGKECEQVQITALAAYLKIEVKIVYVDGSSLSDRDELPIHKFPEGVDKDVGSVPVVLLYRPGHYDLLCPADVGTTA